MGIFQEPSPSCYPTSLHKEFMYTMITREGWHSFVSTALSEKGWQRINYQPREKVRGAIVVVYAALRT